MRGNCIAVDTEIGSERSQLSKEQERYALAKLIHSDARRCLQRLYNSNTQSLPPVWSSD